MVRPTCDELLDDEDVFPRSASCSRPSTAPAGLDLRGVIAVEIHAVDERPDGDRGAVGAACGGCVASGIGAWNGTPRRA